MKFTGLPVSNHKSAFTGLGASSCGWICRALKKTAKVVKNVPVIGKDAATMIDMSAEVAATISSESRMAPTGVQYEPTAAEQLLLDAWLDNTYAWVLNALFQEAAAAFKQPTLQQQLPLVNAVLAKMSLLHEYYSTSETSGLSFEAIELRKDLIIKSFQTIYDMIEAPFTANSSLNKVISIVSSKSYPMDVYAKSPMSVKAEQYALTEAAKGATVLPVTPNITLTSVTSDPIAHTTKTIKIQDMAGKPIEDAIGFLPNQASGSVSNAQGLMKLVNVPSNATVIISHQEYAEAILDGRNIPDVVTLQPAAAFPLDGVTVGNTKANPKKEESPSWLKWGLGIATAILIGAAVSKKKKKSVKVQA